jgi:hypothetical protein
MRRRRKRTGASQPLTPERARAWLGVVREALLVLALAYAVGRGVVTGELSLPTVLHAFKDIAAALGS